MRLYLTPHMKNTLDMDFLFFFNKKEKKKKKKKKNTFDNNMQAQVQSDYSRMIIIILVSKNIIYGVQ